MIKSYIEMLKNAIMFPIDLFLKHFNYCRIPTSVVQLSLHQETHIKKWLKAFEKNGNLKSWEEDFKDYLEGQMALTRFLQSGKF